MSWLEEKYLNLASFRLEKFKQVSSHPSVYNFRCHLCGDSKKRKHLKRGYVYERDNLLFFCCHNCGVNQQFKTFLNDLSPTLYNEYRLECIREKSNKRSPQTNNLFKTVTKFEPNLIYLGQNLNENKNTLAYQYAQKRLIPTRFYNSLYSCNSILEISKQIEKYQNVQFDEEPVLIIPFYDSERAYGLICCRAIEDGSSFRYINFETKENQHTIWGLEFIDWNELVYVFEGAIDAMCFPNSLALGGSGKQSGNEFIASKVNNSRNVCFVYDNDMISNLHILKQVKKRIDEGFSVFIPDKQVKRKDVNSILTHKDMTLSELVSYVKSRTFYGLNALLELSHLSKSIKR